MFRVSADDCVTCGMCPLLAPEHFSIGSGGTSVCHRQPATAEEIELCRDAAECCPTGAIHEDSSDHDPVGATTTV